MTFRAGVGRIATMVHKHRMTAEGTSDKKG